MTSTVLFTVDCLRADHVGRYGHERDTTPNIDALAAESAVYDGYANSPGTRWAMQTLFTGVETGRIDGLGNPGDHPSLPGVFDGAGHDTAAFANNGYFSRHYGYDDGFDRFHDVATYDAARGRIARLGERVLDAVGVAPLTEAATALYHRVVRPAGERVTGRRAFATDADLVDDALEWIADRGDRPFFLWLHLMDAHTPYVYDADHLAAVGGDPDRDRVTDPATVDLDDPSARDRALRCYDAAVRSADEQIGRVLEVLDDDATVVVTGDHGEDFGEHLGFHRHSVYSAMAQVPMVVRADDIARGRRRVPAQHLDVAPTLVAAADLEPPEPWSGRPLQRGPSPDDAVRFDLPEMAGLRRGDWKLVVRDGATPALHRAPYLEREGDDVGDAHPDRRDAMEQALHGEGTPSRPRAADPATADLPETVRRNLDDLGYL